MLVTGKHDDDDDGGGGGGGNGGGDNRDCKIQRRARQRERQTNNSFYKQKNNFARAPRFFVHFFARFCTTTTWKCLISRFMEDINEQRRNLISLSVLGYGA